MVRMVINTAGSHVAFLASLRVVTLESGEVLRIGSWLLLLLLLVLLFDTSAPFSVQDLIFFSLFIFKEKFSLIWFVLSAKDINHLYASISVLKGGLIAI